MLYLYFPEFFTTVLCGSVLWEVSYEPTQVTLVGEAKVCGRHFADIYLAANVVSHKPANTLSAPYCYH